MQTQIFMVHKRHLGLRAPTVLAVGFALTILVGALVLMLPVSAADGQITPFLDALFTAASASCVTGLVTVSTAVHWSVFGKCVILLLIQIGGMGVVTMAVAIFMFSGRKISLKQRWVMQESISAPQVGGIVRMTGFILKRPCFWREPARCFWRCVFARSSVWGRDCGMRGSMLSPPFAMQGLT